MIWWLLTPVAKLLSGQLMPACVPTGAPQSSVRDVLCKKCPPNKKTTRRQKNTVVGVSAGTWGGSSHPFPPQPKSVLFSIISAHNVNLYLLVAYISFVLPRQFCLCGHESIRLCLSGCFPCTIMYSLHSWGSEVRWPRAHFDNCPDTCLQHWPFHIVSPLH